MMQLIHSRHIGFTEKLFFQVDSATNKDNRLTIAEIEEAYNKGAINQEEMELLKEFYAIQSQDPDLDLTPDSMTNEEFWDVAADAALISSNYFEMSDQNEHNAWAKTWAELFCAKYRPDNRILRYYNVFKYFMADPGFRAWAAEENAILIKNIGRYKSAAEKLCNYDISTLSRFSSISDMEEIARNRENLGGTDDRPIALVVYPVSDYNKAFENNFIHSLIREGYKVIYYEVCDDAGFCEAVTTSSKTKPIQVLWVGGHGDGDSIRFSDEKIVRDPKADLELLTHTTEAYSNAFKYLFACAKLPLQLAISYPITMGTAALNALTLGRIAIQWPRLRWPHMPRPIRGEYCYLDISDTHKIEGLSQYLAKDSTIILDSCSAGRGGKEETNIANVLSAEFKQSRIYSPKIPASIKSIEFHKNNHLISLENVEYDDPRISYVIEPATTATF